jgi:hypothetical protein
MVARDVARGYVEMFGEELERVVENHPDWQTQIDMGNYGQVAGELFRILTYDLVAEELVPLIGDYLRSFPSFPLRATDVESAVMRILSMACGAWRYQGFRACLTNGKKRGTLVRAQSSEELTRLVGACVSQVVLMSTELIVAEASPGAAQLPRVDLAPSMLGSGHGEPLRAWHRAITRR